jgi:hypothetical protein
MPTYIRDAGAWLSVSGDSGIPSGSLMLFQQTAAQITPLPSPMNVLEEGK